MARKLLAIIVTLTLAITLGPAGAEGVVDHPGAPASPTAPPPLPAGWPTTLQLGMASGPGDAANMRRTAPFGFRYQYLAGGVNTGSGWANWDADGAFVTFYTQESLQNGMIPVFTYYMLLHSLPAGGADEGASDFINLNTASTMTAYYADLKLFLQRAGANADQRVILHVEPDLWGYMQRRSSADDATGVTAQVSATGVPELSALPDTLAGFAQAVLRLRDLYARNVLVAYHVSVWGTGNDLLYGKPSDATVDELAARAAGFYRSLQANFDLVFADTSDHDAAYKEFVDRDGGASWWSDADYARHVRFIASFVGAAGKRVMLWETPLGNTKMRAQDNTWGHYQDNHVEWLLDDPSGTHLEAYANAGVVAVLFGGGSGTTCACDAASDGVTNPSPINSNTRLSLSADDDGGYFRERAATYYASGALPLPSAAAAP